VLAADEVYRLQSGKDPECRFFQRFAEEGHYAGRTRPSKTRQGIYAVTGGGQFLASLNSNDPQQVANMMRRALIRWGEMDPQQRGPTQPDPQRRTWIRRPEQQYPDGGLVLHVFSRDLPREGVPTDWRGRAWNQDFAWFRADEMTELLPDATQIGARRDIPHHLLRRLARAHLVDNVRGQTIPYEEEHIKSAEWSSEIIDVDDDRITIRLTGHSRCEAKGSWPVAGFQAADSPSLQNRGFDAVLLGIAQFDRHNRRFVTFHMVALGDRWGGTQFNGRHQDLAAAPIGIAFTLAGDSPADQIAPALLHAYGW
jgi:hypothetical protein